tara:strand:- start:286 stop:615 length:330 start_codon:yes stop_codon:yes gene_type:complete
MWIGVIGIFLITSILVLLYTNHPIHREMHTISTFLAIFLAILAFKAYKNYKITKLLFSAFAFIAFGISEGIETLYETEYHDEPFGISEIRDYIIIGGLSLFALGTIPKK